MLLQTPAEPTGTGARTSIVRSSSASGSVSERVETESEHFESHDRTSTLTAFV